MRLSWKLSEHAHAVIEILRLAGETNEACADRLLTNSLAIAYDQAHYEALFGEQTPCSCVAEEEEMILSWELSKEAQEAVEILQLEGETDVACAERLVTNLSAIAYDHDEYVFHFGEQVSFTFAAQS